MFDVVSVDSYSNIFPAIAVLLTCALRRAKFNFRTVFNDFDNVD